MAKENDEILIIRFPIGQSIDEDFVNELWSMQIRFILLANQPVDKIEFEYPKRSVYDINEVVDSLNKIINDARN